MIADKSGFRDEMAAASGAWAQHQRILACKTDIEISFMQLGKELAEFDEMQRWRDLGHASFAAYLADPDVNIAPRTAYRIIRVHKLVETYSLPSMAVVEVGSTKLDMIAGEVTPDNVQEWLNKASALSTRDLKAELNGDPTVDWQAVLRRTRHLCYLLMEHAPEGVKDAAREFRDHSTS